MWLTEPLKRRSVKYRYSQQTMPFGTPDEVRQTVKKIADVIKPDGGYIFCTAHNIQADTSVENVLALLEAYQEYGSFH